jgi:hypothetical protein
MKITTIVDVDAGTVEITMRCSANADPDTTADHAWAAVTEALAHNRKPCSCGDTGWVDDENWSPEYPREWDGRREPGDGRIPCGFCNHGGWGRHDPGSG